MVEERKNINIKDIARLAGVSITTVSHTLSGKRYVKETTKKKIFKIIEKYNYEPNIIARSLIKKQSSLIGVITTGLNNEFYSEIIEGIDNTLSPLGYTLVINTSNYDPEKEGSVFRKLNSLLIDGLILVGGSIALQFIKKSNHREIPVILINRVCKDNNFTSIMIDYKKSFKEAVNYLASIGHKRIGYIGWQEEDERVSLDKFDGFIEGLKKNKIKRDNKYIFLKKGTMLDSFEETYSALKKSFQKYARNNKDISAFVCQTDQIALGAIKALKELGFKIPGDISIIGFGDTSNGKFSDPPLTTIMVPKREMGRIGAENLLKVLEDKNQSGACILLDPFLVIRNSTKNNIK